MSSKLTRVRWTDDAASELNLNFTLRASVIRGVIRFSNCTNWRDINSLPIKAMITVAPVLGLACQPWHETLVIWALPCPSSSFNSPFHSMACPDKKIVFESNVIFFPMFPLVPSFSFFPCWLLWIANQRSADIWSSQRITTIISVTGQTVWKLRAVLGCVEVPNLIMIFGDNDRAMFNVHCFRF